MKYNILVILLITAVFAACKEEKVVSSMNPDRWKKRAAEKQNWENLENGSTYLSIYSEIFQRDEERSYGLTAMVSIRNLNAEDSIYVLNADYYDTKGELIRKYFKQPIFIKPLETIEIVIDQGDKSGGTGANFIFNWAKNATTIDPHFEGIMISTSNQQGISFTTQGIRIK